MILDEIPGPLAHPDEPLGLAARLALGGGLLLFVGGTALVLRRAVGRWLLVRLGLVLAVVAALAAMPDPSPLVAVAVVLAGILAIAIVEQRDAGLEPAHEMPELRDLVD